MRLDRVILHAVGPFEHLDMVFGPSPDPGKAEVHMLVGPNGSGKSTILYALARMFGAGPPLEARFRSPDSYAVVGVDGGCTAIVPHGVAPSEALRAHLGPSDPLACAPVDLWDGRHSSIARIRAHRQGMGALPADRARAFAAFTYTGTRTVSAHPLRAIQEPDESPLAGVLSFAESTSAGQLGQWIARTRTRQALASARNDRALAERDARAVERIEDVITRIIGQEIRFVMHADPLEPRILHDGVETTIDLLPDGLESILSWIADLLMRLDRIPWEDELDVFDRRFFLFLDEVEIHLHPAWQRRILPIVQGLFPSAQIFLSTHSPFVVGSVQGAWVHPLIMEKGKAQGRAPVPSRAGDSYVAILDELFGIDQEFDIDTEALFQRFHALKRKRLAGDARVQAELDGIADRLRARGVETRDIVAREMRQLARFLGGAA